VTYGLVYVLVAGLLSLRHQHAIKPGRFKRSLSDPAYAHRRLYGLCWTAVYYFTPLYFVILSVPLLKTAVFRLFGYRGNTDFTIYPDTWIRDLPVLSIGKGAYLSNRATIGTNIAFRNGTLLVDKVTVGDGALVGHLALLAPGAEIHANAEVGVGSAIGLKAVVADSAKVGVVSVIDHGAILRTGAVVGTHVHVGVGARLEPGVRVPSGSNIRSRAIVEAPLVVRDGGAE
jgi:UDP-3-O-[3-hydroxymyristoyl] glucosamine N-acyltransferase